MRTVSYEEFLKFEPCWLMDADGRKKLERIGKRKERWTALDVLDLPEEEVSDRDKRWAVLREEFIEPEILHEFACRCAEDALKGVENPDPRSLAAIDAKRKWLREEIGDEELVRAQDAATAAARDAVTVADWAAAWAAAEASDLDTQCAVWNASSYIPRQIPLLRELLEQGGTETTPAKRFQGGGEEGPFEEKTSDLQEVMNYDNEM